MSRIVERLRAKLVPVDVRVTGVDTAPVGCFELRFATPRPFAAGEVLAVRVGGTGTVGATWRRYTIADTDGSTHRLIIERNEIGAAASMLADLRPGDHLTVRGPEPAVLAPEGTTPIVVVADLTGLATIAAIVHRSRAGGHRERVEAAVVVEHGAAGLHADRIGSLLHHGPADLVVLSGHAELAGWIAGRYRARSEPVRFLAIGGHDLVTAARQAALAAGAPRGLVRTRTYWKPGRTGLE